MRVQDAARHQLQLEGLTIDHEGVARVMSALVADDEMLIAGEQVGELALPLVTPLGSDDDGCWHGELLKGTAWEPGNTTRLCFTRPHPISIVTKGSERTNPAV